MPKISANHRAGTPQGLLLACLSGLSVAATLLLAPSLPKIIAHFAADPAVQPKVIFMLTLPALIVGLLAPVIGRVLDGFNRKGLLLASLLFYGVCGMAPLLLTSLNQILLSRVGVGLAEAGVMTASTTMIGDYFQGTARQHWLVVQTAAASIAAILFMGLGGALGDVSWSAPFAVYGVAFVAALLCAVLLFEPSAHADEAVAGQRFPWRAVMPLYAVAFFGAILFFVVPIQTAFLLTAHGISSARTIGLTAAVGSIAVPLGSLYFKRFAAQKLTALLAQAFLLIATGLTLFASTDAYWLTFAGVVVTSFGSGIFLPAMLTVIMSHLPFPLRGRGTGGWQMAFFLGNFVSPLMVMGLGKAAGGLVPAILAMAAAAAVAMAGALALGRRNAKTMSTKTMKVVS
jgi:MFS family permease